MMLNTYLAVKTNLYTLSSYPREAEAQISVRSLYDKPFSRYKAVKNRKCT